jgi:disulfide bond formation protein DsbB
MTQLMEFLKQTSKKRFTWMLLALSALLLELAALYFQYGKMELQPCVLCIYERTAVMGILLAGLLGAIAPQLLIFRLAGFLLWGSSAVWGLMLALEHIGIQKNPMTASCDFIAKFPTWAKLDEWFPLLFNPTGFCDEIQWRFLGYTMPQTMIGIYLLYLLALLIILVPQFNRESGERTRQE